MAEAPSTTPGRPDPAPTQSPMFTDGPQPVEPSASAADEPSKDGFGNPTVGPAEPTRPKGRVVESSFNVDLNSASVLRTEGEGRGADGSVLEGTPRSGPSPEAQFTGSEGASPGREEEEEEEEEEEGGDDASNDVWNSSRPKGPTSMTPEAQAEAERRAAETLLPSPTSDDVWSGLSEDRLGFNDDAKAFARLAASKDVKPPLAVAIFGSWGSGKSFFMRLIQEHVERLSTGVDSEKAPEASSDGFHRDIAQIRFNAWHYSETNLWASLVDHLFTQLGTYVHRGAQNENSGKSLLDSLSTTRLLTVESAERLEAQRRTQALLTEKLSTAEAMRRKQEHDVLTRPKTYIDIVLSSIRSNTELKSKIKTASDALGIEDLQTGAEKISSALRDTGSIAVKSWVAFNRVAKKIGGRLRAALLFAVVFATVAIFIGFLDHYFNSQAWDALVLLSSQVAVGLGSVAGALVCINRLATPILQQFESIRDAVDKKLASELAANDELLSKSEALIAAAKEDLAASAAGLVSAVEDFYGSTGTGRLLKFLRTRATDGHYAQHLGLVASVRKDFEELSIGMRGNGARVDTPKEELASLRERLNVLMAPTSALLQGDKDKLADLVETLESISTGQHNLKPPFSRLILYIDDLDRCSHDKVIEVLQAVHMLMAFPLFTVFVAVDVRWLSQALLAKYGQMLSSPDDARVKNKAAPHDYLEKIFQLPYWIEEVNKDSGTKLLEGLLPIDDEERPAAMQGKHGFGIISGELFTPSAVRSLKFRQSHRDLAALFLPYFVSSPRKLLWFINAFRLLKATSSPLSQRDEEMHDFAIIMQLALASISPTEYHKWLAALDQFEESASLDFMFDESPKSSKEHVFWAAAYKAADRAAEEGFEVFDPNVLRHYGRRAHRFCFSVPEPLNPTLAEIKAKVAAEDEANQLADDAANR